MAKTEPVIIAHRGASGYRPEHTLEGYELAIRLGADYIEPDLVSTADDVLVARHENEISGTTDVAERREFVGRQATKVVDGRELTGWFTEDFTIDELKTLRVKERIPELRPQNRNYDGSLPVATLDDIIDLVAKVKATGGREIGIYPETKHPTYFDSVGHKLEDLLLATLSRRGMDSADSSVFIQSMEPSSLRYLKDRTDVRLIQLLTPRGQPFDFVSSADDRTYADLATPKGLDEIASYASGVGPNKDQVIARDAEGHLGAETGLAARAHETGLLVHIWTMRNENAFLPTDMRQGTAKSQTGDALAEYQRYFDAGVDGVFSDNTDTAVSARDVWLSRQG